jgi:AraC-like DNA-binding protein
MNYEFIKHIEGTVLKTFVVTINQRELHFHNDIEILMVLKGSVYIDDGAKRYLLARDDIFVINRNELHSLTRTQESNLLMVIQFDLNFCKKYYPKINRIKFAKKHIENKNSPEYWNILKQGMLDIITCHTEKKEGYAIEMMSVLNHMLFGMINHDPFIELDEKTAASENRHMKRLSDIIEFIQENYMNQISLKDIAQKENTSMYYLSHFIKTNLGISFREYLNRLRLERAEQLLIYTNLKPLDICMECGFSDYKYLKKAFASEFDCTIDEYRKKNRRAAVNIAESSEQHIIMEASNALKEIKK